MSFTIEELQKLRAEYPTGRTVLLIDQCLEQAREIERLEKHHDELHRQKLEVEERLTAEKECDRKALAGCYEERRKAEIERESLRAEVERLTTEDDHLRESAHSMPSYLEEELIAKCASLEAELARRFDHTRETYHDLLVTWIHWWNGPGRRVYQGNVLPPLEKTADVMKCLACSGLHRPIEGGRCEACGRDLSRA